MMFISGSGHKASLLSIEFGIIFNCNFLEKQKGTAAIKKKRANQLP